MKSIIYHIRQLNSLNGENDVRLVELSRRTKFLRLVSNYLSRCIWLVNKLPRAYQSQKQHCSSLRWSSSAERGTKVASHSRGLTRTINFSTSRFENSSRGRTRIPGYRLRAPKIGRLHIRFYFRASRYIHSVLRGIFFSFTCRR